MIECASRDNVRKDHDPLAGWLSRMSHITEKLDATAQPKALLAEGTRRFQDDIRYHNDERYLKLWMAYADSTECASEVFRWLESRNIGVGLALFWGAWAYALEMTDSYSEAADVLAEAGSRGATPAALLEEFREAFQERMHERMQTAIRVRGTTTHTRNNGDERSQQRTETRQLAVTTGVRQTTFCSQQGQTESGALMVGQWHEGSDRRSECFNSGPAVQIQQSGKGQAPAKRRKERKQLRVSRETASATGDGISNNLCTLSELPLGVLDGNMLDPACRGNAKSATERTRTTRSRSHFDGEPALATITLVNDPFEVDQRRRITTETVRYRNWFKKSNMVHCVRQESLFTRWPRKIGTIKRGSRRQLLTRRRLGSKTVEVLGLLGEGASAAVFSCRVAASQQDLAVKIEREVNTPSLPWECFITVQLHQRLLNLTRGRKDGLNQLSIEVILPDALFIYRDGCAMTMPQGSSGTLHDLVVAYAKNARSMPQLVAMHYTIEMLRFCRGMHSVSVLHMDIKPDNWLLTTGSGWRHELTEDQHLRSKAHSLSLIDFGRAIDLSVFPQNGSVIEFTGHSCAKNFSCPAMIEGLAWKHDADLFALGSCIYFMLHGVYLEVRPNRGAKQALVSSTSGNRWRPAKQCKRYWEVDLWDNVFDRLLNSDSRESGESGTAAILSRLEDLMTAYIRDCPPRVRELRELLHRQDNMLHSR